MKRRGFLKGVATASVGASAGCISNEKSNEIALSAGDMEWMDRIGTEQTYAEFAERSAEMSISSYNRDMQNKNPGHLAETEYEQGFKEPIIDEESVKLNFTEVESEAVADRYQAHLEMQTNEESVFSDFENYMDENVLAQAFGTVMMPTVGTLFNDAHGPDYRVSQREDHLEAIESIEYTLEDNNGNSLDLSYDQQEVDELSETYNQVTDQKGAFYEDTLERL